MKVAVLAWILALTMVHSAAQTSDADCIFIHGNIYTGAIWEERGSGTLSHSLTAIAMPRAQALAIRGERLLAIGSDADINKLKGKHTRVAILAGFLDAGIQRRPPASGLWRIRKAER